MPLVPVYKELAGFIPEVRGYGAWVEAGLPRGANRVCNVQEANSWMASSVPHCISPTVMQSMLPANSLAQPEPFTEKLHFPLASSLPGYETQGSLDS